MNHISVSVVSDDISDMHDDVIKWRHFPRYWLFVREAGDLRRYRAHHDVIVMVI